ncbi:type IV conjugative transfer system protein TraE [Neisseria sp. Ec49-e6-T10]|uniref:type IV conjugative transfer system protein TraE n=1 Tax=Neisseria sp. Ec49-e6-T10 TaxID=3140744 RepID=UPI003EB7EF7F
MKLDQHLKEIESRTGIRKIVWVLLFLSIISTFLLTLVLLSKKTVVQTILVPPEVNRSITMTNTKTSKEYLEEMAIYTAQLLLNATPQTVEKQHQVLLNYVAPEYYQALSQELIITQQYLKKRNISTWFVPRRVTGYEVNNTVKLEGQFISSIGDKIFKKSQRILLVQFKNQGGRISLLSIKEEIPTKGQPKKDQIEDSYIVSAETVPTESTDFRLNQEEANQEASEPNNQIGADVQPNQSASGA